MDTDQHGFKFLANFVFNLAVNPLFHRAFLSRQQVRHSPAVRDDGGSAWTKADASLREILPCLLKGFNSTAVVVLLGAGLALDDLILESEF